MATDTQAAPPASATSPHAAATDLDARVESIIFSNGRPAPASRIAEVLAATTPGPAESPSTESGTSEPGPIEPADVEAAVERLNAVYAESGRSFRIERVAGGYRVMTRPEFAGVLAAFHRRQASARLSRASIETLAIIAYQQPITRARLEAVRGVGCGEVLKSLLERRLIAVTGRAEELGRPLLYGTTRQFLDAFGLGSIRDLPALEQTPAVSGPMA